jgi:hypothetical protein
MKKKLIFIGLVIIALVLTSGTFAFGYSNSTATLQATMSDTIWATYDVSPVQPDWAGLLPQGGPASVNLVPVASGNATTINEQFPATGEHWDKVAEQPADGNATYVSTYGNGGWQGDLYQIADLPANADNISSITVFAVFASADSWTVKAMTELQTNDLPFSGITQQTSSTNWVTISTQYITNPATSLPWTKADVNSLQAGVSLKGSNPNQAVYCTQVYVQVNYYAAGIVQGPVPQGNLFEVIPNPDYTGDLLVKIYLMNAAKLIKAYQYLNMTVYTSDSIEAGNTPNYKVLSLETGVVEFNIKGGAAVHYYVSITGGSYTLMSDNPANWGAGYTITPEFYCEVTQR